MMSLCGCSIPMQQTAVLHVFNHILTFAKLATYSASVVKSNFGNFIPP